MRFGVQHVLQDVTLGFDPATVHGLVGHNGSGKSTLIKVLAGYHRPTTGSVRIGSTEVPPGSTPAAYHQGLRFVHQDLGLIPEFDALENFGLGAGYNRTRRGTVDWAHQRRRLAVAQLMLQTSFAPDRPVREFRPVERTFLAIARAIAPGVDGTPARFVMLDEPTTALERPEAEQLFALVRRLADQQVGVLYVSHQLDDVLQLCDSVSILRDGRLVETMRSTEADRPRLVAAMLYEETAARTEPEPRRQHAAGRATVGQDQPAPPALAVEGLRSARLRGISFQVGPGECVCVVGLSGSGREELVYAVAGAIDAGVDRVALAGQPVDRLSPIECRRRGIALIPGNRLPGSIVGNFTVQENISFAALPNLTGTAGVVSRARERALAEQWIARLDIRPPEPSYPCRHLSGGNKQKVILARWLAVDPTLLLIDEPTAGVDVGAATNLLQVLRSLADEGRALLISTSEVSDVLEIADRVLVLNQGNLVSTLTREEGEWTESALVGAMSESK